MMARVRYTEIPDSGSPVWVSANMEIILIFTVQNIGPRCSLWFSPNLEILPIFPRWYKLSNLLTHFFTALLPLFCCFSYCIRHIFGKWPSQKGLALDVLREFPQIRKSYRISPDGIGSLLSGWVRPLKSRKRRFLSQKCSFCWAVIGFWPPWFPTGSSVDRERERGAQALQYCNRAMRR